MTPPSLYYRLSLRQKFLAVLLPIIVVLSALMLWVIVFVVQQLVGGLASTVAANRVQADSRQMSRVLVAESTVAKLLAAEPFILSLLNNPDRLSLNAEQAERLNRYRLAFAEQNLFIAHNANEGFYYFNREVQEGAVQPLYILDSSDPSDRWYFQADRLGPGCHLNVDYDRGVQVTKVWFNCGIFSEEGQLLGVVGSGVELNRFVDVELVPSMSAIQKLFIDDRGAIQLHQNRALINEDAFAREATELILFSSIYGEDAWRLIERFFNSAEDKTKPKTFDLDTNQGASILAVAYVPEINWYALVVVQRKNLLPSMFFLPIIVMLSFMVALFIGLLYLTFYRLFLLRLLRLDVSVAQYRPGHEPLGLPHVTAGGDEITRLEQHIVEVSQRFFDHTQNLETLVKQRTEALERLAATDDLTGCANRRSFLAQLEAELRRSRRHGQAVGLLVLDLNNFKQVNDEHGHAVGDAYLKGFVEQCLLVLRDSDVLGRLGGDEFAVLLLEASEASCQRASERLQTAVSQWTLSADGTDIKGSVSIGYALMTPDHPVTASSLMERADKAMYRHKERQREDR